MMMINILYALHPPLGCFLLSFSIFTESLTLEINIIILTVISAFFTLLFIFDTHGRYRDYVKIKTNKRFNIQKAMKYRRSWCQRTLYSTIFPDAKRIYKSLGYRWYHLLPDGFLTFHSPLLKINFYRQLISGTETIRKKDA